MKPKASTQRSHAVRSVETTFDKYARLARPTASRSRCRQGCCRSSRRIDHLNNRAAGLNRGDARDTEGVRHVCRGRADDRKATCRVMMGLWAYTLALPKPTAQLEAMLERLDADAYMARSQRASWARVAHVVKLLSDAGGIPSRERESARVHLRFAGAFALSRRLGVDSDDARRCGDVPQRTRALDRGGDGDRFVTGDRRSALQWCVVLCIFR